MSRNETLKRYDELVAACDQSIRAGRIDDVVLSLSKLNFARVPRPHRQALAKIARRCGEIEKGLALLSPVLSNEKLLETPPSAGEICEYSVLLSRNGSIPEALGLLAGVDARIAPESLLYMGFCHVSDWDYARAQGYFERFLATEADPYSKLIARANLAACYVVVGPHPSCGEFLTQTLEMAIQSNATRLAGNCHELRAQWHLVRGDLAGASADLDEAHRIFGNTQSYDQLLIEKWRALIEAIKLRSAAPLHRYRTLAAERKFWEFVRDADLLALKMEFDQPSFDHLVFGTPAEAYRARIRAQLPYEPSSSYVLGRRHDPIVDLSDANDLNGGKKIHQMLVSLSRDFYAPRRLGSLFAELYPEERFDVHSSNLRIRQILNRTRRYLESRNLRIDIEYQDGGYRLSVRDGIGLKLELAREPLPTDELRFDALKTHFESAFFSAHEACAALGISRSTFHAWADRRVAEGRLSKRGVGKATRYSLIQAKMAS